MKELDPVLQELAAEKGYDATSFLLTQERGAYGSVIRSALTIAVYREGKVSGEFQTAFLVRNDLWRTNVLNAFREWLLSGDRESGSV